MCSGITSVPLPAARSLHSAAAFPCLGLGMAHQLDLDAAVLPQNHRQSSRLTARWVLRNPASSSPAATFLPIASCSLGWQLQTEQLPSSHRSNGGSSPAAIHHQHCMPTSEAHAIAHRLGARSDNWCRCQSFRLKPSAMPIAASCRSNEASQLHIGVLATLLTLQAPPKSPPQRAPALGPPAGHAPTPVPSES